MKHLLAALLLIVTFATTSFAQGPQSISDVFANQVAVQLFEQFPVPHPFFAQKHLRGDAYEAWCLLHNKAEYERASATRKLGALTTVHDIRGDIYGNGVAYDQLYGISGLGNARYTQRDTTRTYEIGGRSGGPVTLYNPYVTPDY